MKSERLELISVENILPHPDNPRKEIGDLEELIESIKKNGIMQNLTVIPSDDGKYMAIIGHRRLAAAKAAGLKEVPAKIVEGLTHREQVGIMLEENMQRADLTVPEQAYGFQMMLDLGETEDSIAEKTGFSKQTIRHRLQIARLNKKVLNKQWNNHEFQLSLADLIELEKIKNIKDRDHMLRTASDSRDLRYKIRLFLEKEKRKTNKEIIIKMLQQMGIQEMSTGQYQQRYSNKWRQADSISLENDPPEKIIITGMEAPEKTFYAPPSEYDSRIWIYMRTPKEVENEKTEYEKRREEAARKRKEIEKLFRAIRDNRKVFIQGILDGSYGKPSDYKKAMEDMIEIGIELNVRMYPENLTEWITKKRMYNLSPEQREEVTEKIQAMDPLEKILIMVDYAAGEHTIVDWQGKWYKDTGEVIQNYHGILQEQYGFNLDDEELQMVLEGTHKDYVI